MLLPSGKTPLVDTSQAEGFNMSVLKRMDEDILEILYSATHVAVYEFDTSRRSWKRSDIEGTLFLVKRCSAPRFRMIVVNSKRIDNFIEEVDGSLECEVLQTFLLYTRGNNQLYGIWFYDEKNCEEFGNYLKRIIKGMPKSSPSGTPTIREKANQGTQHDLRSELQSIFNQLSGQSSGGSGQSCSKGGESDHLMRLFLQAQERSPATATVSMPLTIATTTTTTTAQSSVPPASTELPNADVVLSLDTLPSTLVDTGPLSSSPLPFVPLPPEFFKPSSKMTTATPTVTEETTIAPDPVVLPLPIATETTHHVDSNGIVDNENAPACSLERFFWKNETNNGIPHNDDINTTSTTAAADIRDRFRQALVNLLNNDDILDLLIAEFKKVGIPLHQ